MKKLSLISACRILLLLVTCLYFKNVYIYILCALFLLLFNYKHSLFFVIILVLILSTNSIKTDYIKVGIVDRKINDYYEINKILYKTKVNISDDLNIGDIIYTNDYEILDDNNYYKKNIKYINNEYKIITSLKIKRCIFNRVNEFDSKSKTSLDKFIYNISNYDDLTFNLGYGLSAYYLIKWIHNKNKKLGIIALFIYSFLFYFDNKFILILIDYILEQLKLQNKRFYKVILICLVNYYLIYSYSIAIPLILSFVSMFNKQCFKYYFSIIQSMLFGYINVITIFLYEYLIRIQIVILIFSMITVIIPSFSNFYLKLINIYSKLNNINLDIRGSVSLISLIILFLIFRIFRINNNYLKCVLLFLIILSPINKPFYHVSFIDVGQGDAILLKSELNKANILIDTGSNFNYYKLKKKLYSEGIYKLDYLVITHNDSDHNGNYDNLMNDFIIKNVINEAKDINYNGIILKNIWLDKFNNDNDNSLIYLMNKNDLSILFTGDISSNVERKLIKNYNMQDIDILKVSHHGSNTATSDYFIGNILPKIACISTSGLYGHPHKQTIDTLNNYNINTYITKQEGNIDIFITKYLNILKTDNLSFAIIK